MPFLPSGVIRRFRILRPKPAGIKTGLVPLAWLSARSETASLFLSVLEQRRPVEHAAALLAKYDPLRVIGKTPPQIANAANCTLFYDQAVFHRKSRPLQAKIVVGIAVETGEKVGVAVFL